MTQYPSPFLARFSAKLSSLQRDVAKLKTRTAGIDSGFPLMMLPGQVDPSFSGTGSPKVFVNGQTTLSGPFQNLASYTPVAGDSVLLAPVGAMQSYVIIGKVVGTGTSLVVPPT